MDSHTGGERRYIRPENWEFAHQVGYDDTRYYGANDCFWAVKSNYQDEEYPVELIPFDHKAVIFPKYETNYGDHWIMDLRGDHSLSERFEETFTDRESGQLYLDFREKIDALEDEIQTLQKIGRKLSTWSRYGELKIKYYKSNKPKSGTRGDRWQKWLRIKDTIGEILTEIDPKTKQPVSKED